MSNLIIQEGINFLSICYYDSRYFKLLPNVIILAFIWLLLKNSFHFQKYENKIYIDKVKSQEIKFYQIINKS